MLSWSLPLQTVPDLKASGVAAEDSLYLIVAGLLKTQRVIIAIAACPACTIHITYDDS
jgi:hypothetical protein